jgi:hypothetical protein
MAEKSYEDRLGDALEKLLEQGAEDLAALATGLNTLGVTAPGGQRWTAETLAAEFKRLGH